MILSLVLTVPAMAKGPQGPAETSLPHFDINFITGSPDTTADSMYQIQVSKDIPVTVTFWFTSEVSEIWLYDYDGTDGEAVVVLPAGYYWEVFGQARGKVGTWAQLDEDVFSSTRRLEWGDPFTGGYGGDGFFFDMTYVYGGCSNLATRWVYLLPPP